MKQPTIIQGGMGVSISNWRLARAVSEQGQMGVVSGTCMGSILIHRLMDGDVDGHMRRALSHFPFQEPVERILDKYYVPGGKLSTEPYIRPPMWKINPSNFLNELTIIANFAEVFLAREGHDGLVGINLLEKIQMPTISSLYGAMLAGVDAVIIGAGIPTQVAGIMDKLARHEPVSYRLDVTGAAKDDEYRIHLVPDEVFPGISDLIGPINRPHFYPIISSVVLAKALLKRSTGAVDGFVIETPLAGGHNAPPRGTMRLDEHGEPIYGKKDEVNPADMLQFERPFWLAGGYGTPQMLKAALDVGAAGIQVGTAFAYCDESGMSEQIRHKIIQKALNNDVTVRTSPIASPTGFPFKVVDVEGSLSDMDVYNERQRVCDIGFLRHLYKDENGKLGYRCSAEPIDHYVTKGGNEDDAHNRACLCNHLFATAGQPQVRKGGYVEPPIITSGDALTQLAEFVEPGKISYSAKNVIDYLTSEITVTVPSEVTPVGD